jgi:hypothetical protein
MQANIDGSAGDGQAHVRNVTPRGTSIDRIYRLAYKSKQNLESAWLARFPSRFGDS